MVPLSPILQMFGHSPIRPLQGHMEKVVACVGLLPSFFQHVIAQQWEQATEIQQTIAHLEREADDLKKNLRLHLPKNLFLPVPRSDLLEMLTMQDRLANKAKDIAGLVIGRQMRIPNEITPDFITLVDRCIETANQAEKAIDELDELLEAGFRGNEVNIIESMLVELDRIENITDKIQCEIRQTIFKLEKDLPPIDVVFLYKLIEWVGDLADHAHHVGGQLYLLLAR